MKILIVTEDETIDDKYGVAVVFHDDEEEVGALLKTTAHMCVDSK